MNQLARECEVFTRHLIGRRPTGYVVSKYVEFHRLPVAAQVVPSGTVDRALLAFAVLHPCLTQIADAFGRFFVPGGSLRKKLVLLLALLETSAPSCEQTDLVPSGLRSMQAVRLVLAVLGAGFALLLGCVILLPWLVLARAWKFVDSLRTRESRSATQTTELLR